jgi:type III secretory pathway component EscS
MRKNIGGTDKIIRLLVAIVLIVLYFSETITGTLGIVGLVIAAVLALTSLVNFCPLYSLLGIRTCKL